jgi:8-oxo-dGTP diphosphatase
MLNMRQENLFYLGNKAIIRNEDGRVLLLLVNPKDKSKSRWDLPGGRVNKGEETVAALKREILEETGITDVTIGNHLGMALTSFKIPISNDEQGGLILSVYVCNATNFSNLKPEENVEIVWSTANEVIERLSNYPEELLAVIKSELNE